MTKTIDEIMNDPLADEHLGIIREALENSLGPNTVADDETSTHDLARNGKRYIIEWNPEKGTVSITQAVDCSGDCPHDDPNQDDGMESCENCSNRETYDYSTVD